MKWEKKDMHSMKKFGDATVNPIYEKNTCLFSWTSKGYGK